MQPAILTRSLTKQFDRQLAVNQVDLQIEAGEVFGLIGPNGAGKTTLIRLLASAEEPTMGEIYINGVTLKEGGSVSLKRQLGYLPDDFPLYDDLTVWDYLDYFARLYHLRQPHRNRRLFEVLELVQLSAKRHTLIATLSRGMKQRLSLARTIIHQPVILLLDEPVSGLDPIARSQFRDSIKLLQEAGMTIVISSHVLSDLEELCTSIGVMEFGFLVEQASLRNLFYQRSRQQILIATLGDRAALQSELTEYPQIDAVEFLDHQPATVRVHFSGNDEEAATLLRSLVAAGIPVSNFHRTQDNLETIFLKLGHQQAT